MSYPRACEICRYAEQADSAVLRASNSRAEYPENKGGD